MTTTTRRKIAAAGIWIAYALIAFVIIGLGAGRIPPLAGVIAAALAAVSIFGFRWYLRGGQR